MGLQPWLYIVLLGVVLIWFARLIPKPQAPAAMAKELEQTIDAFTAEMEEENKELLQTVSGMKHEHDQKLFGLNHRIEMLEKQNYDLAQELKQLSAERRRAQETVPAALSPEPAQAGKPEAVEPAAPTQPTETPAEAAAASIKERYAGLLQLHQQGKSVEYIAKKLGMNKGEVQLILQLVRQGEASRA